MTYSHLPTLECTEQESHLSEATTCDPNEAPEGFFAVPLSALRHDHGNLCRQCDWRKTCQDANTDFLAYGHRCKGVAITAYRDGKIYRRKDRCTVVFKRKP